MDTMAVSRVIFLLHCSGLAQLSSYVFARPFDACNHTAIVRYYQYVLQGRIEGELAKEGRNRSLSVNIINCCPHTPRYVPQASLMLDCIDKFTINRIQPEIQNITTNILAKNCDGYFKKIGTQNGEVPYRNTTKCRKQRARNQRWDWNLLELLEMWKKYLSTV